VINLLRFKLAAFLFVVVLGASAAAIGESYDFTTVAPGTAITNQYSGVVFSLAGGPATTGSPTIGGFYCSSPACGVANSPTGGAGVSGYPTTSILDLAFTSPVDDLSFTFANWGSGNGSFYTAYDGATVVATGVIDGLPNFGLVSVAGVDITDLKLNNNSGGNSNWIFGVGQLNFTSTPEPGSWLLFGSGILGMAGMLRRKFLAR